jgi:hypothetical protein
MGAGECVPYGGTTILPSTSGGCPSDPAPEDCCLPPSPEPNPTDCATSGGLCAPVGGCLDAGGYFTSKNGGCMTDPGIVCCVPHTRCGDRTIDCCSPPTVFSPNCENGTFVCIYGTPAPYGTCPM